MSNLWETCFNLMASTTRRITPTIDLAELKDATTGRKLLTQNLKKTSSPNTTQVKRDRQTYAQADIIWITPPGGGQFDHRVDVRVDKDGHKTGELYKLHSNRREEIIGVYPDNPNITLEDLLNDR